ILKEISMIEPYEDQLDSIYLGGGTPSLMEPHLIETLLDNCGRHFSIPSDCEITLEANPGTLTFSKLKSFKEAGINRLSLGVQSFSEVELKLMGRIHDREEVYNTVEWLRAIDLKNFSIDLIYGIPGQTMEIWLDNLRQAIGLNPTHVSCYLLQLDEETPLGRQVADKTIRLLTEDEEADLYYQTIQELVGTGFEHYELSNFALPGFYSRHNLNYWRAGEYIGIGAGAVSYRNSCRYKNRADVEQYTRALLNDKRPEIIVLENMDQHELLADAMILGLRLIDGVDTDRLAKRFGIDPREIYHNAIKENIDAGLLAADPPNLRLTNRALFLSNQVFRDFLNI
ncbi:MAG: radical SAM family heme chaperone HemW, partial [Ignavibacteriales bacterium]